MRKITKNKNRIFRHSLRRYAGCLCLFVMSATTVRAQSEEVKYRAYLQAFKRQISDGDISYRYTFSVFSDSRKGDVASMKGVFSKSGKNYLDSSAAGLNLISGGYVFKLRYKEKDAFVYSMKSIQENMGVDHIDNAGLIAGVPDSLLFKAGHFDLSDEGNGIVHLKYTYSGKASVVDVIDVRMRSADTALLELKVILKENTYRKQITLYDFKNKIDPRVTDISRYFKIAGNKVTLSERFKAYKVSALL